MRIQWNLCRLSFFRVLKFGASDITAVSTLFVLIHWRDFGWFEVHSKVWCIDQYYPNLVLLLVRRVVIEGDGCRKAQYVKSVQFFPRSLGNKWTLFTYWTFLHPSPSISTRLTRCKNESGIVLIYIVKLKILFESTEIAPVKLYKECTDRGDIRSSIFQNAVER